MNPEKALPGYKTLADAQKEANEVAEKQLAAIEQTNILLTSLSLYYGDPKDDKGWLERNYELNLCRKKNENKRYGTSFKITVYTLILATGLAVTEFFSGVPVFSTFWEYGKGLFTL